jgi:hypothetical protein
MSYGTMVFDNRLTAEITGIKLERGLMTFSSVARRPKKKDIPSGEEKIPMALYGQDGSLIATGKYPASVFDEAKETIRGGDLYLNQDIEISQITFTVP